MICKFEKGKIIYRGYYGWNLMFIIINKNVKENEIYLIWCLQNKKRGLSYKYKIKLNFSGLNLIERFFIY